MTLCFLPNIRKGRSRVVSGIFRALTLSLLIVAFGFTSLHAQTSDSAAKESSNSVCQQAPSDNDHTSPIIGTWFVKLPDAPFQYHMFSFHADGTMQQANPDDGDANTSDSNGLGIWILDGDTVKGKFVEVTADRTTHQFVSRGEISFVLTVKGNAFTGNFSALFFDVDGNLIKGPLTTTGEGQRVVLP